MQNSFHQQTGPGCQLLVAFQNCDMRARSPSPQRLPGLTVFSLFWTPFGCYNPVVGEQCTRSHESFITLVTVCLKCHPPQLRGLKLMPGAFLLEPMRSTKPCLEAGRMASAFPSRTSPDPGSAAGGCGSCSGARAHQSADTDLAFGKRVPHPIFGCHFAPSPCASGGQVGANPCVTRLLPAQSSSGHHNLGTGAA